MAKFTKLNIGDIVASSGGRVWKKLSAESAKATITFTVAGTEYQAEDGMTWAEWCESDYNTQSAHIEFSGGTMTVYWAKYSSSKFYAVSTTEGIVAETDAIIADYAYTTKVVTHA